MSDKTHDDRHVQNNNHIYCYKPVSHPVVTETFPVSEMLCLKSSKIIGHVKNITVIFTVTYQCQKYLDLA
jgi:hypothetical protein